MLEPGRFMQEVFHWKIFLSSDIELLLEYFFHSPVTPALSPTLRKALTRVTRASGVFRFLCSPLHHFATNCS